MVKRQNKRCNEQNHLTMAHHNKSDVAAKRMNKFLKKSIHWNSTITREPSLQCCAFNHHPSTNLQQIIKVIMKNIGFIITRKIFITK
jgi:hypothetical protein